MDMTWENLTKLFTWAAQHGSDAPLADTAGEQFVVDSAITKEDLESAFHGLSLGAAGGVMRPPKGNCGHSLTGRSVGERKGLLPKEK